MTARRQQSGRRSFGHVGVLRFGALTALALFGTVACTSDTPATEVRGEVLSRADDLGGPNPAVAEFRAGERAVYGTAE